MKIRFKQNKQLDRLEKLLSVKMDSEAPSPMYIFPDALGAVGMLVSILATPVILWSLFRLKRYGWLLGFGITVIVPAWCIYYLMDDIFFINVLALIPLFFLVIYYIALKQKINDWREPIFINEPGSDYTRRKSDK